MRERAYLESIKSFIDRTYSRYGNALIVDVEKKYDPEHTELGYCYKYKDAAGELTTYNIVCSKIGKERTDFRILMHEYGHIYLAHLDGIHEELDIQICNTLRDHRQELIDTINKSCGIDFAEKLLERVIDDPSINHSLHNIAMDMEVNSKILSAEDIDEMEMDISEILNKKRMAVLEYARDHAKDEDQKKEISDSIDKMRSEAAIKLISPERYYLEKDADGNVTKSFPSGLSYPEYLLLLILHLDQFVKMIVDIKLGGKGDTSQVSWQDIQNVLNNMAREWASKSKEYRKGYNDALNDAKSGNPGQKQNKPGDSGQGDQDYEQGYDDAMNDMAQNQGQGQGGMQSLSDLMNSMGIGDGGSGSGNGNGQDGKGQDGPGGGYKGTRPGNSREENSEFGKDHGSDSRRDADKKRETGQIRSGASRGCGNSGGPDTLRDVRKNLDDVDMALQEVFMNVKNRVVKIDTKKDLLKLYNRGINRSVIAPTISRKITMSSEPKIVYLIDISGSMDTRLIDRILGTIARNMKRLSRGLKYDVITWSTRLGEHLKDIDPRKGVPQISSGGGTSIAGGIQYFKDHYGPEAVLVVISDFEDYLEEWHNVEKTMPAYSIYGFDYGCGNGWGGDRHDSSKIDWTVMKVRKFNNRSND